MSSRIQNAVAAQTTAAATKASASVNQLMAAMLDSEKMRTRFEELLGKRTPQFLSSLVSMVNADANLQQAFYEAPMTVIQAALKAATFDLPIDPNLGYAYIVPFRNSVKQADGAYRKRMEATFILGYKGMHQLALRTGVYKTINVMDIREGELRKYNRLTEEIDLELVEDEEEREKLPVVGYVGYFRLLNGTEKTIYMTKKQIEAHEKKNRKGDWMGKGWKDNFDAMALKTVYRRLIGKWGVMSIDYRTADVGAIELAQAVATGQFDGEDQLIAAGEYVEVDDANGETEAEAEGPEQMKME